jgi:choline dehydrogenase-like flavoprotein
MIFDADHFQGATDFSESDVLIVGAGPVGLTLAEALSRRGIRSVLLEAGDETGTTGERFSRPSVDRHAFSGVRRRHFGLGGGFNVWAGQCLRFHDLDFAHRSWVPQSGWPIGLDTMSPFYAEAEQFYGISADGYHGSTWRRFGLEPASLIEEDIAFRFSVFAPEADIFARDRAAWRKRTDSLIFLNANVVGLDGVDGSVDAVRVVTRGGRQLAFSAGRVVIAAGAIETARLLLIGGRGFPQGIGNDHGHVGAHLQDHPRFTEATIRPSARSPRHGDFTKWFSMLSDRNLRYLPRMVLSASVQEELGILNGSAFPRYEWPKSSMTAHLRALQDAVAGRRFDLSMMSTIKQMAADPRLAARMAKGRLRGTPFAEPPSRVALQVQVEQNPGTSSRVRLGDSKDAFGRPQATVSWVIDDLEVRSIRGVLDRVGGFLDKQGFGSLVMTGAADDAELVSGVSDSQHQMGTARMASDPTHGVVDASGQVFGVANLYLAGGSTFPTGSYANPTLTMAANAFRLAAQLHRMQHRSPLSSVGP